jgi:hypothetical protein
MVNMINLSEKMDCCGKIMQYSPNAQSLVYDATTKVDTWLCLECGRYITLTDGILDEEELENIKEQQ